MTENNHAKRQARQKQTAEVFTQIAPDVAAAVEAAAASNIQSTSTPPTLTQIAPDVAAAVEAAK